MAWRNRRIKGRSQAFRKMNLNDEDYDMPLLVQSSSLSPRSNEGVSHGGAFNVFHKKSNSSGSGRSSPNMHTNIAAVHDDFEALSFPVKEPAKDIDSDRTSDTSSPLSFLEQHSPFVAQFHPEIIEEKSESATPTVFDDDTSNDGSVFTTGKNNTLDEEMKSLRAPSIVVAIDNKEEEAEDKEADTKSPTNSNSESKGGSPNYIDEDADDATWNADEMDAIAGADGFGNGSAPPHMEISGVDLLSDRDGAVNELQEVHHLMTFNALVLIQKQKDWIEGSVDATDGANKGSGNMITMELENLERKIKLLMNNKAWPNALERRKQEANPFTPSKAFFKSMAMIDRSIQTFHKGYLKHMSKTSEENHDLKSRVAELVELNASLQEEASRSNQKTNTIRNLQQEREDLVRMVGGTDHLLATLLINDEQRERNPKASKFLGVKSYIQRLETERSGHLASIRALKSSVQNAEGKEDDIETSEGSSSSMTDTDTEKPVNEVVVKTTLEDSSTTHGSDLDIKLNEEADVLNHDLGLKWNYLEQNELAMCSKEEKIKSLSATVTGQESSLESVRAECKLMRMQLLQLETTRNEYKIQCELKDSSLQISQDRIASLEEEILRTHAHCATYEEDYEALRDSFATQKVATKQELTNSKDDVKVQVEYVREEFEEKLKKSEEELKEVKEDRDRVVRDLKASVEEIEAERDSMQAVLAGKTIISLSRSPSQVNESFEEEKEELDEDILVVTPVVSPTKFSETDFEQIHGRFAEKASKQAFTIAQLTEENEIKDEQLKSLQQMVEMLLGQRDGTDEEYNKRPVWGRRLSNLRTMSQNRASGMLNRSRHGSMHGSQHGSQHGMLSEE